MSDFKTKMMQADKDKIYKFAIAGVIISLIVLVIFVMSLGDAKKFGERDICSSATAITATTANTAFQNKSINKSYTVYLIDSGSAGGLGKDKNTFYIVQQKGNDIVAYKVAYTSANKTTLKSNILNYFNTVKEESLPTGMVAGGLLTVTIIVPLLLALLTVGLWVWWYFLKKSDDEKGMAKLNVPKSQTKVKPKEDRRGVFGQTNHPFLYWWIVLVAGIFLSIVISEAIGLDTGGTQSILTTIFCGTMLFMMPTKIKKSSNQSNNQPVVPKIVQNKSIPIQVVKPIQKPTSIDNVQSATSDTIVACKKPKSEADDDRE